jgi:hypothetical protein
VYWIKMKRTMACARSASLERGLGQSPQLDQGAKPLVGCRETKPLEVEDFLVVPKEVFAQKALKCVRKIVYILNTVYDQNEY